MGKRKRSKQKNANNQNRRTNYQDIVRENEDFEKYYKAQFICPPEEWNEMKTHLQSNLPTGFRITSYPKYEAQALLSVVKSTFFKDLFAVKNDESDDDSTKPFALPWYPDQYGWQIQITRNDIRKSEAYFRLHNFLISETQSGNISRQEVVSMIPPILLNVQSHHKVLDMCAAPGSKTAQLIEQLHSTCEDAVPTGIVVANDIDNQRCYMLVHQAKRLNSPCAIIVNHDAAVMPNFIVREENDQSSILKFDRILCDVPCSGDGTMRKNPDIWLKWNAANGNNLHGVQIRILKRGLEMLEIGGRLVYSTCSLNPIEDEAVIHRLLVDAADSVQLVDVSTLLPGLKFTPGLSHWKPASKDLVFYDKYEDVPEKWRTVVRPPMFPPSPEDAAKFNLNFCIRILPHHQNTGGFFVAVLTKLKPLPWEAQLPAKTETETIDVVENNCLQEKRRPKKRLKLGYKEDPFVFFSDDEDVWQSIRNFYDVQTGNVLPSCLFTRCLKGKKKNIYVCSPLLRKILTDNQTNIKIINSGVRLFVRCDKKTMGCAFRLAQEGVLNMQPFFGSKRLIRVARADFVKILKHSDPAHPLNIEELDPETQEQLKNFDIGSCIIQVLDDKLPFHIVGWRGTCSFRAYIALPDNIHYLRILGEDVSSFEVNKFKKIENDVELNENDAELNENDAELNENDAELNDNDAELNENAEKNCEDEENDEVCES